MNTIMLNTSAHIVPVNESDIVYCRKQGKQTLFALNNGTEIKITATLTDCNEQIHSRHFFFPNRSYIVNQKHIKSFHCNKSAYLTLSNNHKIPVSFSRIQSVTDMIENRNRIKI